MSTPRLISIPRHLIKPSFFLNKKKRKRYETNLSNKGHGKGQQNRRFTSGGKGRG